VEDFSMRDFVRYLSNLTDTIKSQQKGLRRLSRRVKRLREWNHALAADNDLLTQQNRQLEIQNDRFARRLADATNRGLMV
jgi:predicted RNase H-like nuclease (RuvC/YqgF family)